MNSYVDATKQLVAELFVRNMKRSKAFYHLLGFTIEADRGSFVVLSWEDHELYLDERPDLPAPPRIPQVNIRIMTPDVDRYWQLAQQNDIEVFSAIKDQDYGLRDFTLLDPDRIGLRFGTRIDVEKLTDLSCRER